MMKVTCEVALPVVGDGGVVEKKCLSQKPDGIPA